MDVHTSSILHNGKTLVMSSIQDITELRRLEQIRENVEHIIQHDLKSPLNGLINFPFLLLEDENLTQDQREMIAMVGRAASKILNLINSSLEMHKVETGTYRLRPEPCNPMLVLRDNADILAMGLHIKRERIKIQDMIDAQEGGISIRTDKMLFDLVVMNLMKNAIEASDPDTSVLVDLSVQQDKLVLSISNSRPVPVEVREKFFEKYATAGKRAGTGLGTYSAFIMTRAMGGSIDMETSDEKGTKVTVRIPISPKNIAPTPQ